MLAVTVPLAELRLWQCRWFKSLRFKHSSNPYWQLLAKYYIITGMIMILVVVGTTVGLELLPLASPPGHWQRTRRPGSPRHWQGREAELSPLQRAQNLQGPALVVPVSRCQGKALVFVVQDLVSTVQIYEKQNISW
jgi:hypothetical protein